MRVYIRTFLLSLLVVTTFLVFGCSNPAASEESDGTSGDGSANLYDIGDEGPAGGLIFYVDKENDYDGWTYLEAAPATWTGGTSDPPHSLASGSFTRFPVTTDGLGDGKENTDAIIDDTSLFSAAVSAVANASVSNGDETYEDWYLPSRQELELMYVNLRSNGDGGFRTDSNFANFAGSGVGGAAYWSSSINSSKQVWITNMILADPPLEDGDIPLNQSVRISSGDNRLYVRPVRRF